jgi:hypothetical protein
MSRARRTDAPSAPTAPPTLSGHRREAEIEAWACEQLKCRDLFAGTTTREIRRDRLVALLTSRKLMDSHAGRMAGKPQTWRELVTRLYGPQEQSLFENA